MEKRLPSGKHLAQQRVLVIVPLQHRMEQKGQQVEAEQKRRQILLAMPKVVLQMIALGLEHIVVFVFDLPPATTCLRHVHRVGYSCSPVLALTTVMSNQLTDKALSPL